MITSFVISMVSLISIYAVVYVLIKLETDNLDKYVAALLGLVISIAIPFQLEKLTGWPTSQSTPNKFTINWVAINEPSENKKGDILILISTKDGTRLYKLPYSEELHKEMAEIQEKLQNGEMVNVDQTQKNGKKAKESGGKNKSQVESNGEGPSGFSLSDERMFYVLPDPLTTRKDN